MLEQVFERWHLDDKIIAITSDGAANILKALSDCVDDNTISDSHRCVCHTLHLVVGNALKCDGIKLIVQQVKDLCSIFNRKDAFRNALLSAQQERGEEMLHAAGAAEAAPDPHDEDRKSVV